MVKYSKLIHFLSLLLNHLNTKRGLVYLKTQSYRAVNTFNPLCRMGQKFLFVLR